MGALACTPSGERRRPAAPRKLGANLLPGERLTAFVRWSDDVGRPFGSLMVYASGHLGYRTHPSDRRHGALDGMGFRCAEASMDEVWRMMGRLEDSGFAKADRAYGLDEAGAPTLVSVYAPMQDKYVEVFGRPSEAELPAALGEALALAESLRTRTETGVDPFGSVVSREVRPLLARTDERDDGTQEVDIFENGALELRWVPRARRVGDDPWALTRRLRSGTLAELQRLIDRFDEDDEPGHRMLSSCELVTTRSRRRVGPRASEASRALNDATERLVAELEPGIS